MAGAPKPIELSRRSSASQAAPLLPSGVLLANWNHHRGVESMENIETNNQFAQFCQSYMNVWIFIHVNVQRQIRYPYLSFNNHHKAEQRMTK